MRKVFAFWIAAMMLVCMLVGCGAEKAIENNGGDNEDVSGTSQEDDSVVNLMDMYSVKDPEDVEYDQRVALYMPVLENDESYASGARHIFSVIYGKDGKGVYMYDVEVFDSEESATAFKDASGEGKVDGNVYVSGSDETFFAAMESFIPDFQTWVDNMMASGMIEVE